MTKYNSMQNFFNCDFKYKIDIILKSKGGN